MKCLFCKKKSITNRILDFKNKLNVTIIKYLEGQYCISVIYVFHGKAIELIIRNNIWYCTLNIKSVLSENDVDEVKIIAL